MVIKLDDNKELHSNNIMTEDDATSSVIDDFWGIGSSADKTVNKKKTEAIPHTDNSKDTKEKITKNTVIKKEEQTPADNTIINTETENKNEVDYLSALWVKMLQIIKVPEIESVLLTAEPHKYKNGVVEISVQTKFAEECLMQYKKVILKTLKQLEPNIADIRISSSFNTLFYVRAHNNIIANKNISNATFRIYCALLTYRNNASGDCTVGTRRLIDEFSLSPDTLSRAIKSLEDEGYIKRVGLRNYRFPLLDD